MDKYIVPVTLKEELQKKLEKLAKKASAYGNNMSWAWGNEVVVERALYTVDPDGHHQSKTGTEKVFGIEVSIESDIIRKGNYTVVCGIDHDERGNIVTLFDDTAETDVSWYTMTPYCEHCGTRHAKRHTYIVKDADGNCKQVGRSCLKDYCGICPEMILMSQEITALLLTDYSIDEYDFSGSGEYAYNVRDVIMTAIETINRYGYVKSCENNSTKDRMISAFKHYNVPEPSKESEKIADDMREYFSRLDYADLTDYQRNLKSLLSVGYARMSSFGYLAYAPLAYKQMIEKDARKQSQKDASANSAYIGKVGDRITADIKDAKLITSWETVYGFTYLYKFVTNDGNVLTWFASKAINTDAKRITGTVKEHKDYDGEKQTIVTRCKVA